MRWAVAELSGAPLELSTDTVVDSPWLLRLMRYFSGAEAFSEPLNSLPKKPLSF